MIIIEKSDSVLLYSVNPQYFDKFSMVSCGCTSSDFWRTAESNTNAFICDLHFRANDEQSGEMFIEYKNRMTCIVKIEDEKRDALQMLTLIKEFHGSMNLFIKNNSLSHFSKLRRYLEEYQITELGLIKMEASMACLKDMKRHEDKSELHKMYEKEIENIELNAKIIKVKID